MNIPALIEFPVPLFEWMCRTTLEASVLIGFYLAIRWLGGRWLNPHWMRLLGLLVVARLLMPGVPPSAWSVLNLAPAPPVASPAGQVALQPDPLVSSLPMPHPPVRPALDPPPATAVAVPSPDWTLPLAWGWLTGVVVIVLSSLISRQKLWRRIQLNSSGPDWRLRRLLHTAARDTGVRARATLLITPAVQVPALFGWWRPRLLLPAGLAEQLTDRELGLVLRHELIHLKSRDVFWNWIAFLALALHWINPLAWLAVKGLRADQELACDAEAVAGLADDERNAYGALLLNLAVSISPFQKSPGLAPIIHHPKEIHRRIQMIARYTPTSMSARLVSGLTVLLLVCVTFTRAADQPGEPEASPTGEATAPEGIDDLGDILVRVEAVDEEIVEGSIESLKQRLKEEDEKVRARQVELSEIRERLSLDEHSEEMALLYQLHIASAQRTTAQRNLVQTRQLMDHLADEDISVEERRLIAGLNDDDLRTWLKVRRYALADVELARQLNEPDSSKLDQAAARLADHDKEIEARMSEFKSALSLKEKSEREQLERLERLIDDLNENIDETTPQHTQFSRYLAMKRDLEDDLRIRAALALRITQEQVKQEALRERPRKYRASLDLNVMGDQEQALQELWEIGFRSRTANLLTNRGEDGSQRSAITDVEALPDSDSIRVTVLHGDEKTAADIARAIAAAYLKHHRNARVVAPPEATEE